MNIKKTASQIKKIVYQFILGDLVFKFIPVKKNVLMFSSFYGQHYSDGPRAISERLHETHPEMKIYWAFTNPQAHEVPEYIDIVDMNSLKYYLIKTIASACISNVYIQGSYLDGNKRKDLSKRIHLQLEHRKKQIRLTTWHGTPLKRMGNDEVNSKHKRFVCNKPLLYVVGNTFERDILMRLSDNQMTPFLWGSPRSHRIRNANQEEIRRIKERLGFDRKTKVVLFAPTFRSNGKKIDIGRSGIDQLNLLQFAELSKVLSNKFGGDNWVFICRFHNMVENHVNWDEIRDRFGCNIINGNTFEDITDYYLCSDIVITDYSSVMFDFMESGKPIILFCHDFEQYSNEERGLYIPVEKTPFIFATNFTELAKAINGFKDAEYQNKIRSFKRELGYIEGEDNSIDRIIELICRKQ